MSAPAIPAILAIPAVASTVATPTAASDTSAASTSDSPFSRLLANQRRPAHTSDTASDEPSCHTPDTDSADLALDATLDQDQDAPPDAALATLALDIATQTAAQLRGAALRARDPQSTTQASARTSRPILEHDAHRPPGPDLSIPIDGSDAPIQTSNEALSATPLNPFALSAAAPRAQPTFARLTPAATAARPGQAQPGQAGLVSASLSGNAVPASFASPLAVARDTMTTVSRSTPGPAHRPLLNARDDTLDGAANAFSHTTLPPLVRPDSTVSLQVAAPLGSPQWGPALGRQLVTLGRQADGKGHSAELRLDPPELGPLRVTLTLNEGVAHAAFASPHASVRQAIEAAMDQLQSALSQAGISLGQTSVSDQQAPEQFVFGQAYEQASGNPGDNAPVPASTDAAAPARTARSDALVDTFA